ncbi:MAG: DUF1987 domain-containing protein, partial [Bacteroidales bacterium]|nr:DUF1987 domain-containing protein [Bacteroidales bacterium]
EDTPSVIFDLEQGIYEISGRSLPEDVVEFYTPVMSWLDQLEEEPIADIEFSFKLEYFNTASSKLILDVLLKLDEIFQDGTSMNVRWYYFEMDEDLMEAGEEYAELIEIPVELVTY